MKKYEKPEIKAIRLEDVLMESTLDILIRGEEDCITLDYWASDEYDRYSDWIVAD